MKLVSVFAATLAASPLLASPLLVPPWRRPHGLVTWFPNTATPLNVKPSVIAVLALALLASYGCTGEPDPTEWRILTDLTGAVPCERSSPGLVVDSDMPVAGASGAPGAGATVILRSPAEYCDIVARPVATLSPAPDGWRPDPGVQVVMSSSGRYFTTSAYTREILAWAPDGTFLRAAGTVGDGPGEISPLGVPLLFMGPGDTLFVLDAAQRWHLFDQDLEHQRSFLGRYNGRNSFTVSLIAGEGIVTTARLREASSSSVFHLMNFDGSPNRSFGPTLTLESGVATEYERLSVADGAGHLWIAPANGEARGLVLERWNLQGELTLALERRVDWLPPGGYAPLNDPMEPRLPEYDYVHLDESGLLWVVVVVRDPRWRHVEGPKKRELARELFDARLEVIDPSSGVVLASYRHDSMEDEEPPFSRFISGNRSFRVVEDSAGFKAIEIFDLSLVRRSGA